MRLVGIFAKALSFKDKGRTHPCPSAPNPNEPHEEPSAGHWHCGDVPYVHQRHINMCGDACVNMLVAYKKGRRDAEQIDRNPRGVFAELPFRDLEEKLSAAGLAVAPINRPPKKSWPAQELARHLSQYGPIICGGQEPRDLVGHYVLLTCVRDEKVVVHDPWGGRNREWSLDYFNRFLDWKDRNFMVAGAEIPTDVEACVPLHAAGITQGRSMQQQLLASVPGTSASAPASS
ncbi:papain-like cysteine protease family protein [Noviherbaspirillum cavernae]|nr:papain-like cysteine protease family protein [Noviherbaspirillum cavernae]